MTEFRAITIRQPWARAVADGHKDTENRSRASKYRGLVLIHAGAAWSARGAQDERIIDAFPDEVEWAPTLVKPDGFATGVVLGVAELVDCHRDVGCCRPWGESFYKEAGGKTQSTIFHYRFAEAERLDEPVPAKGSLGPLWRPSDDLVRAVQAQGAAA